MPKICNKLDVAQFLALFLAAGMSAVAVATYASKILPITLDVLIPVTILVSAYALLKNRKRLPKPDAFSIVLIAILIAGLATRVYPIKDIQAPLFADPALEGTIARLIIDNQKIPSTWEPFLPIKLEHQPGFASIIAWISATGVTISQSILFFTNILHALFPFSIYFLAIRLLKDRLKAVIAAVVALVAAFPTYTFVAGMNSMAAAFFMIPVISGLMLEEAQSRSKLALIAFLSIGMALIHPVSLFFLAIVSFPLLFATRSLKKIAAGIISAVLIPAICVLLVFSPALHSSLAEEQWNIQKNYVNPDGRLDATSLIDPFFVLFGNPNGAWYFYAETLPSDPMFLIIPAAFMIIFAISTIIIIKSRDNAAKSVFAMLALFMLFSVVQSYFEIRFPGWEYVYPTRIKFFMIVPISLILSYGFASGRAVKTRNYSIPSALLVLLIASPLLLCTISNYLGLLSNYSPVGSGELGAINWIAANTGKNETVLNLVRKTEAGAFIGDAGQWIPALTGRSVVFPATSITDDISDSSVAERMKIMELAQNGSMEEFSNVIRAYGVGYIFVSERTLYLINDYSIDAELFANAGYEQVFSAGTASIFKVR